MEALETVHKPEFAFTLPREIIELHRFTSEDETQFNLHYVQLSRTKDGRLQGVATNGHYLARAIVVVDGLPEFDTVLLHRDTLAAVKLKKNDVAVLRVHGSAHDKASIQVLEGATYERRTGWDATFQNWEQVLPVASERHATKWGLDLGYVADIATYLKKCGHRTDATIAAPADGAVAPMTFEHITDDFELMVVLMPYVHLRTATSK